MLKKQIESVIVDYHNRYRAKCCQEWQSLLLAVGFFTRIPVPSLPNFKESDLNASAKYFPLVGILVGVVGALAYIVSHWIFPQSLSVLISMGATIYLTGAFHEDGLADSADGLGGGWGRAQILTIMQDSRLGTYGAIALWLMLFAKFQVLNTLPTTTVAIALVAAHAVSRLAAVWVMATLSYSKPAGKAKPLATAIHHSDLKIAHVWGLLPWLGFAFLLWINQHQVNNLLIWLSAPLLLMLLVWAWWVKKITHHLQGYTGDTLGATQQLTELAFYIGVYIWSLH